MENLCVQMNQNLSLFGNHGRRVLQSEERIHPAVISRQFNSCISDGEKLISVNDVGSWHIWKGSINAEEYTEVLEQHLLPSRQISLSGKTLDISAKRC